MNSAAKIQEQEGLEPSCWVEDAELGAIGPGLGFRLKAPGFWGFGFNLGLG